MSSIQLYSFRTNKHLRLFKKMGLKIFVFGKLKEDLIRFKEIINKTKPKLIIGLAEVKTQSMFETQAINKFTAHKKINKNGKDTYPLYTPTQTHFPKAIKTTTSFCNWTLYSLSELIEPCETKLSFLHFNQKDISNVLDVIRDQKAIL